ncbi:MAG: FAD-dependent oxidoreductase [Patescibacteria group bacterium]
MKIAVIGSGVSGLSAAWLLAPHHEVVLLEKDSRLGGHAHTVMVTDQEKKEIPVDTGFMVFNPLRYPNLVQLFKHLNIESIPTSMSFAVSIDGGAFEFNSNMPNGIFADRSNILNVSFYEFLIEINRFNVTARECLKEGVSPHQTLWEWLKEHKFSEDLGEKYLLPLIGSVWSTPKKLARNFPCGELLRFLDGHHLLAAVGHPQWQTVVGGSSEYVKRIAEEITNYGGIIRLKQKIKTVRRSERSVDIVFPTKTEKFDYVVFATHADDTLTLLSRPSREEKALLSKFKYEKNEVYLHSDPSLMPRRKDAWAAWNYLGRSGWGRTTKKVCLTYDMNTLQHLKTDMPIFVTLNPYKKPKSRLTHKVLRYSHPMCTCTSMEMRERLVDLQNRHRSLFCGAYFGYGFHEDGITSAIEAVRTLDITPPWEHER